jgi:hypothetical protein
MENKSSKQGKKQALRRTDVSGALPIPKVPKEFCQCKNPLVHDIQCPCGNDR